MARARYRYREFRGDVIRMSQAIDALETDRELTGQTSFYNQVVLAALGKLTGWRWQPWPAGREGRRSVFREARDTAETCIALSFMGW